MKEKKPYKFYTEEYIRKHADVIYWKDACALIPFDLLFEIADDYSDMFDWGVISNREDISIPFIQKYIKKLNFAFLSLSVPLDIMFEICEMDEVYIGNFAWFCISNRDIPESFVRKYQDKISWITFSRNNCMELFSDEFFEEFEKYIHWNTIFNSKNFTLGFKERFKHKNPLIKL